MLPQALFPTFVCRMQQVHYLLRLIPLASGHPCSPWGARAHYHESQLAAKSMVASQSGLIVNISFWAAQKHSV